ncbi:cupin domain-containing protein [Nocardioides sp. CN2-186]|uniref:cupin domain-containing protein n=1 Tax=Nocardioides tweenelious TaxID=3156607 RepID=UPI0032B40DAC
MKRALLPLAALALVGSGFAAGITVTSAAADDPAPVVVTRQSLAEVASPPGAPHRTLGLSKVVVMPGAQLAAHHHPGQQLGYVAEGTLTYTVETGSAKLMKGSGDDPTLVKKVKPGDTVKVKSGQWLIEEQGEVHHAANNGTVPVVILLSTLFKTGEPAAIPD